MAAQHDFPIGRRIRAAAELAGLNGIRELAQVINEPGLGEATLRKLADDSNTSRVARRSDIISIAEATNLPVEFFVWDFWEVAAYASMSEQRLRPPSAEMNAEVERIRSRPGGIREIKMDDDDRSILTQVMVDVQHRLKAIEERERALAAIEHRKTQRRPRASGRSVGPNSRDLLAKFLTDREPDSEQAS